MTGPMPSNPTTSPSPVLPQGAGLPGGGPPEDSCDWGEDGDDAQTSTESSARTSALRSALRRRAREQDRPKTSISSVRIEEYRDDGRKFLRWRRAVEAQERLYKLDPAELSMLVYLSTCGEARDVLDQRPLAEFTSHDGLRLLWRLLEEAFGESTAESSSVRKESSTRTGGCQGNRSRRMWRPYMWRPTRTPPSVIGRGLSGC